MLTWEAFTDSYPSFYLKKLRKEEASRREEMIKARPETHETENKLRSPHWSHSEEGRMWRRVVLPLGQGPGAALLPELLCSLLLAPTGVLPLPSSGDWGACKPTGAWEGGGNRSPSGCVGRVPCPVLTLPGGRALSCHPHLCPQEAPTHYPTDPWRVGL